MRRSAAAALLFLVLGGCNRSGKREIAVIPKGTAHVFWQSVQAGARAAGKEYKADIIWDGPPNETDYSRQIEIFDSMVARHVDGIAVAADDRNALNNSLDRAARAKIPVTVFDSGVDSTNYMTFVATNNYEAGHMGARQLAKLIGGKGMVGMIMHAPGSASTMDRERGFQDAMAKEFPGVQIAAQQFGMADRAKAMAAAENILTAHVGLSGLFASSEPSSVGAAQAIKSRGLAGKIRFVAFDSSEGLVEDLKGGAIDALVAQDPFRIGYEAVKTVAEKLDGKTPPKRMDLSARVITKADLDKPEIKKLLHPPIALAIVPLYLDYAAPGVKGLPPEVRIPSYATGQARLQVAIRVDRDGKNLAFTRLGVDVMTTCNPLKLPAAGFQQAAQFRTGDRLHTATSRIKIFESG